MKYDSGNTNFKTISKGKMKVKSSQRKTYQQVHHKQIDKAQLYHSCQFYY